MPLAPSLLCKALLYFLKWQDVFYFYIMAHATGGPGVWLPTFLLCKMNNLNIFENIIEFSFYPKSYFNYFNNILKTVCQDSEIANFHDIIKQI